ncbi:guanylate-binding protein 1-like [Mus caroli]|uniref:Guanylate-binding protein 1-like n=1 Tax=Mus caroli TaxID=10089 RepID=A0A6P5P867_MUSCR|nr:guanylate-binding protein 1-like [Mus caroli]
MLRKYFESKEDLADTVLKMDQSLTEKEKRTEVEHIKAEAAEAANRALAEMQTKHELLMAQKEQSYQEHMKQLTEKMEQEQKELMAEQQRIISLKLQEQERLFKEEFQNESRILHQEIQKIREKRSRCTIF